METLKKNKLLAVCIGIMIFFSMALLVVAVVAFTMQPTTSSQQTSVSAQQLPSLPPAVNTNPFVSPAPNPFDDQTVYENPFDNSVSASPSAGTDQYANPF